MQMKHGAFPVNVWYVAAFSADLKQVRLFHTSVTRAFFSTLPSGSAFAPWKTTSNDCHSVGALAMFLLGAIFP